MSKEITSEIRHDPIQKRWIIIAAARKERPQDFKIVQESIDDAASCPFCPGAENRTPPEITALRHDGSEPNTPGWTVRVVPNRFPALSIEPATLGRAAAGMYDYMNGVGAHEIVIEGTEHRFGLADFPLEQLIQVFRMQRNRMVDLMRDERLRYVLVFKNHRAIAGASLSHPHSQIIATPITPRTVAVELETARDHFRLKERCLFCDIIRQEVSDGERIIYDDGAFIVFAPYASRFPFELFIAPRNHAHHFGEASDEDLGNLAECMLEIMNRLKNGLNDPPYNYVIHTAPNVNCKPIRPGYWQTLQHDFHWHIEVIPRLTKMAGFEWGSGFFINPTPPEVAAEFLRKVSSNIAE